MLCTKSSKIDLMSKKVVLKLEVRGGRTFLFPRNDPQFCINLQIIGVSDRAEKDEIVKSVMHLKNAEIEDGYTMDAVVSRQVVAAVLHIHLSYRGYPVFSCLATCFQNLLMDVRDKLLFEPEYAGNIKERVPPRSSLRIPWAWLSSALCLLQEVRYNTLLSKRITFIASLCENDYLKC